MKKSEQNPTNHGQDNTTFSKLKKNENNSNSKSINKMTFAEAVVSSDIKPEMIININLTDEVQYSTS